MTTPRIEAIIFDLGRVLVAIDNTLLVEQLFKGLDADNLQELGRKTMTDPAMVEFNTGRIGPKEFHRRMCDAYQLGVDFDEFKQLWCRIFYPMDGMKDLIRQLRPNITLGMLSDTDPLHWNHIITTWPWLKMFETPTLSYQTGVMKPDPAIYLKAAENVNTSPENCLYIDDLQDNVEGARAVGMTALQFENISQIKNAFENFTLL